MKTQNLRLGMAALFAVNALMVAGCHAGSAEANPNTANDPLAMQPAPPVEQLPATPPDSFTTAALPSVTAPAPAASDFKPSANLSDVIRLARSGVSDGLLHNFITNTQGAFDLGAEGIVYLHDLGLTDETINLMLQHDNQPPLVAQSTVTVASPQPAPAPTPVVMQEQPEPEPTVVMVEQPAPVTVNYFYNTLSPYGTWIEVDGYGRCWQPTIVLSQSGWQPYCDNGRWVYSNHGWYWVSDYSWGATFHYGRWFRHPHRGWCWMPDNVWGPAWVSWRQSSDYCGWAPLPPLTSWVAGIGLTFRGSAVSVGFDFGLSSDCYTFVPRSRFCDRRPFQHALPHPRVAQVFNNTTVINNYGADNRTIVNRGIPRENFVSRHNGQFSDGVRTSHDRTDGRGRTAPAPIAVFPGNSQSAQTTSPVESREWTDRSRDHGQYRPVNGRSESMPVRGSIIQPNLPQGAANLERPRTGNFNPRPRAISPNDSPSNRSWPERKPQSPSSVTTVNLDRAATPNAFAPANPTVTIQPAATARENLVIGRDRDHSTRTGERNFTGQSQPNFHQTRAPFVNQIPPMTMPQTQPTVPQAQVSDRIRESRIGGGSPLVTMPKPAIPQPVNQFQPAPRFVREAPQVETRRVEASPFVRSMPAAPAVAVSPRHATVDAPAPTMRRAETTLGQTVNDQGNARDFGWRRGGQNGP